MGLTGAISLALIKGKKLLPRLGRSTRYKHWVSVGDLVRCEICKLMQGKIWKTGENSRPKPPLHPNCRCRIEPMETIQAGTATIDGFMGTDWMVKYTGKLPNHYITTDNASNLGWKRGKSPSHFIPGKIIGGDVYRNKDGHLPNAPDRIWYEADINYIDGRRNSQRILWSDDGLVFVTYDHYMTFYEIV